VRSELKKRKNMTTNSVTLTVQIACPAAEAYQFIADPATMPQWAIHNVKAIRPVRQNEWEIQTPRGAGRLIPHYDQQSGILDHEFVDPEEGSWEVSARIVPAGTKDSVLKADRHHGDRDEKQAAQGAFLSAIGLGSRLVQ
jgi:hypothetical protein